MKTRLKLCYRVLMKAGLSQFLLEYYSGVSHAKAVLWLSFPDSDFIRAKWNGSNIVRGNGDFARARSGAAPHQWDRRIEP